MTRADWAYWALIAAALTGCGESRFEYNQRVQRTLTCMGTLAELDSTITVRTAERICVRRAASPAGPEEGER